MRVLVTGSSGHLGEGLVRVLRAAGHEARAMDIVPSPWTDIVGSILDRATVEGAMTGVEAVLHTATLHKPHVATSPRAAFVDMNIAGTLNLLEVALAKGVRAFVYTSTTSVFGMALEPAVEEPAAWIDEEVAPIPKNIYGVTKKSAEDLCELFHRRGGLPCVVLRTARFFQEEDDDATARDRFEDINLKANEFVHRRVDLADVVDAHLVALAKAESLGFGRFVVSATTPFARSDLQSIREDAASVVQRLVPECVELYAARRWRLPTSIDRVYVNDAARRVLDWRPVYDFRRIVGDLSAGRPLGSDLARAVGAKGYHERGFLQEPYPTGAW